MKIYTCPMHPEVEQNKPGHCSKCGMSLIVKGESQALNMKNKKDSYKPLVIIIGLITLTTFALAVRSLLTESFTWEGFMMNFMAGFFLVFSGFKLLDVKGFAEGYSTYDLIAKRIFQYGYVYPFIELALGLLFAMHIVPPVVTLFTLFLMTVSGIGVAMKVAKHEKFQCACLGTFLKVPLTKVTLIEDFGMAAMALFMIIMNAKMA